MLTPSTGVTLRRPAETHEIAAGAVTSSDWPAARTPVLQGKRSRYSLPPPLGAFPQVRGLTGVEVAGSVEVGRGPRGRRFAPVGEILVSAPPDSRHLAGSHATTKAPCLWQGAFVVNRGGWRWRESNSPEPIGTRRIPLAASTSHRVPSGSIGSGRVRLLTPSTRSPSVDRRPHHLQELLAGAPKGKRDRRTASSHLAYERRCLRHLSQ